MTFVSLGASLPKVEISVDFANAPTSATRTWVDVTPYVRAFSTRRGREHELARPSQGILNVTLDNADRRFDPTYTSSPYSPNVLPMRRIRALLQWNSVTYNLFHGYVQGWPQSWPNGRDAIVELEAFDAFAVLNLYDLVGKTYAAALSGARMGTVFADCSLGTADYATEAGLSTIVASGTISEGTGALSHLLDVAEAEGGYMYVDAGGTLQFEGRHHRLLSESSAAGTLGDASGEIRYAELKTSHDASEIWNEVRITPSGGTAETASDSTSQTSYYKRTLVKSYIVSDQSEALNAAQWSIARYKDPDLRTPEVAIIGARDTTTWPTILARELSDRVTLLRRPPGGGTIDEDQYIEAIRYDVRGREWRISWLLSPADSQAYWVLDDANLSVLDTSTRLAY